MDLFVNQRISLALVDAARLLREAFEHAFSDMKMTWPQIRIMSRIYAQEGIAQSELGAQLEFDAMTISRQVDRLVDLGLIERRTEAHDRRLRSLYLTAHSRSKQEEILGLGQNVLRQALKDFDEEQQKLFLSMLLKMSDNLCEPGPYSAPQKARTRYSDVRS
ncbi:MarR family winged helix-turn-helix transcriptional regulator [Fulvimarina sp. MAC3]|uniref:MarR family winged helix-turn-helix transcriptional regulator n=1 Tax=Fulvimarina sp. MAC3 TaxID=3148887 RepID=UPI0031FE4160